MSNVDIDQLLAELNARKGVETPPTVTEVEKGMIRRFCIAVGNMNPLYVDEAYAKKTRFGGIVAPPTFVAAFTNTHFPEIIVRGLPFARELHSDDHVHMNRLIRAGDVITAFARYDSAYARTTSRGPRVHQCADLILLDANRERVANVRIVTVAF
jgi:N-terminal half of MaoC dehydratase